MIKSFQKRSDIEALQKLMHELGIDIDLGAEGIEEYNTPDYYSIKLILKDRLSKE